MGIANLNSLYSKLIFVLLAVAMVLGYQSCGSQKETDFHTNSSNRTVQGRANGEGYPGKLVRYEYYSETEKCRFSQANGERPPNAVIFATLEDKAQLVREDCQDITPVTLDASLAQFEMSEIVYQGRTFPNNTTNNISQVQLPCPVGQSSVPSIVPQNLVTASLDLFNRSWYVHSGVNVVLDGSIQGLPIFNVQRQPLGPQWSRILEVVPVQAGRNYAATAIVEPGISQDLRVLFTDNTIQIFEINVNLGGPSFTVLNQDNATNIQVNIQPLGRGHFVTIFFTPSINANMDVGMGPAPSAALTDINLTGIQLISNISQYCQ